jgi:cation diffusion facilitator family transporter
VSAGDSRAAVIAALAANIGIAAAKVVGFVITGSGSMLAEAGHSFADCGNQGLLLVGARRAKRSPDESHPFGFTRERYFSAFLVAIILFTLGAGFAAYEGVEKLTKPHAIESPAVAIAILVVAIGLEAFSLRTAVRTANATRGDRGWWTFIRQSKNADLGVVLLEDTAALVGLVLALAGVGLSAATHDSFWDALGTVAIAALLATVAVVLATETKSLLIGEAATPEETATIHRVITSNEAFQGVVHLRTEHRGPDEILVAAKVAVAPGIHGKTIAKAIDETEAGIRAALPHARYIFIEPDIRRAD